MNLGDEDRQHGTAILGILAAAENNYGLTGIVPRSQIGVSSTLTKNRPLPPVLCLTMSDFENAINSAAAQLNFGDIILIEEMGRGPGSGGTASCNKDQFNVLDSGRHGPVHASHHRFWNPCWNCRRYRALCMFNQAIRGQAVPQYLSSTRCIDFINGRRT